jgi:hypothetical protein
MTWTRAIGLLALTGFVVAQETVPFVYSVPVNTVTQYGGRADSIWSLQFSFAIGPDGSSRVPDGLKRAFESVQGGKITIRKGDAIPAFKEISSNGDKSDLSLLMPVPPRLPGSNPNVSTHFPNPPEYTTTYTNSTETVHDVLEDGSRVVQVETTIQSTGTNTYDNEFISAEMTRTHKTDGSVFVDDVLVNLKNDLYPNDTGEDAEFRSQDAKGYADEVFPNEAHELEVCYKAKQGLLLPLYNFAPTLKENKPMRSGDLRVSVLPDGRLECRKSVDTQKYGGDGINNGYLRRDTLIFGQDGRLDHSEFVASHKSKMIQVSNFEYEGKVYRVRSLKIWRIAGSSDRLL